MKKQFLLGLVTATLLSTGLQAKVSKEEVQKLEKTIPLFQNQNIRINRAYDLKDLGLYQVKTVFKTPRGESEIPAFIDKKTKVVFVGTAYKPNGERINMPIERELVDPGVAFTYGSGKKGEIYVFTDPECPFCRRLEKKLGKKMEDYKVNLVLFPLSFHSHAKPMTQWILRGANEKEKAERMKKIMNGSEEWKKDLGFTGNYKEDYKAYMNVLNSNVMVLSKKAKENIEKDKKRFFKNDKELEIFRDYLKKSANAFKEVGARGTPTIMTEDFKKINPASL